MHILANMRPKICIKGRLIISSKFVTIWVTNGEGGQGKRWLSATMDEGAKSGGRPVKQFLNGPKKVVHLSEKHTHFLYDSYYERWFSHRGSIS